MQIWFSLSITFFICGFAASEEIKQFFKNATWYQNLDLKCNDYGSLDIYITSTKFGYIGGTDTSSCTISVGKHVRALCNGKRNCRVPVIPGPALDQNKVRCHDKPSLYVKYMCIKSSKYHMLRQFGYEPEREGYMKRSDPETPNEVQTWPGKGQICYNLPHYAHFTVIDLNLLGNCKKQKFSIEVKGGVSDPPNVSKFAFCEDDVNAIKYRNFGFSNFTNITFRYHSSGGIKKNRGFLIKYIVMQCGPVFQPNNTDVVYTGDKADAFVTVACKSGFLPFPGSKRQVKLKCGSQKDWCDLYECRRGRRCDPTWKPTTDGSTESDLKRMRCVKPEALTTVTTSTSTTTTTTSTTTTVTPSTTVSSTPLPVVTSDQALPHPKKINASVSPTLTTSSPYSTSTETIVVWKTDPRIVAGIIGSAVGFVVCLIIAFFIWIICRSRMKHCTHWCCCCLGWPFDKSELSQSYASGSVDDSTMAVRYRVSTMSSGLDSNYRASLAASSTVGSISFPSYRRSKKKPVHPLPHPSLLGVTDESSPLFVENGHMWSPSIETYLEPNRRPSLSSMGATGGGDRHHGGRNMHTFHPRQKTSTEYQVYDETRSSRNALDRFDGPDRFNDPRRSQALQSNHYYCRDDLSVDSDDSLKDRESVYEQVDDGLSSVSSTPRETRRMPTAARNEYVQPPALPARPPTMDRSSRMAPLVSFLADEDDGYQPVNVSGRVNV